MKQTYLLDDHFDREVLLPRFDTHVLTNIPYHFPLNVKVVHPDEGCECPFPIMLYPNLFAFSIKYCSYQTDAAIHQPATATSLPPAHSSSPALYLHPGSKLESHTSYISIVPIEWNAMETSELFV